MLRGCSRVIALAVMLFGLPTAQAADETLTLACKGTTTDKMKEGSDLTIDLGGGTAHGSIYGTIDRVTGDFSATYFYSNATSTDYALKCSPAQRVF